MDKEKVYIILNSKVSIDIKEKLYIKDIGEVFCLDEKLKQDIESIKVYNSKEETWDYINTVNIVEVILRRYPKIELDISGASNVLLEVKSKEKVNKSLEILKVLFVCITLFFGAALGIMYFHEDVNMSSTLEKLYYTFSGEKNINPLIMNIPYSIGLGVGMIVFFTRIYSKSKRRRMEPSPLDTELFLYDNDMEGYILQNIKNKNLEE